MTNRYMQLLVFHEVGSIFIGVGGQSLFAHVYFTLMCTTHCKYATHFNTNAYNKWTINRGDTANWILYMATGEIYTCTCIHV